MWYIAGDIAMRKKLSREMSIGCRIRLGVREANLNRALREGHGKISLV